MKYFLQVYGCQYNAWDAARIKYMLDKLGFVESLERDADLIFAISCSVRKSAVDRLLGKIKNWNDQGKKIVVSGCILKEDKPKFIDKNVILWDPNKPEMLSQILKNNTSTHLSHSDPALDAGEESSSDAALDPSARPQDDINKFLDEGNTGTSYLPIMSGCNNFCSYCVVPYTRGREQSRKASDIICDFKKIVKAGAKEIMLLGQNVNSYSFGFAKLLKKLNDVPEDFTISFTSNHPKDMTDDIIYAVRDLPKVKKEIHLPLQSGSDTILKSMNRPYSKDQYLTLVNKIKKEIPEIKLTTDIIVGFPGETEKDFKETVKLLKKINFSQAFVNKYSPRSGTAAFKLKDPIPWSEKQRRWRILNDLVNK